MKKSKPTKSNEQYKILRMIARDEELERNQGKWVAMNRIFRDKSKYNRKDKKKELRKDLSSYFFYLCDSTSLHSCFLKSPYKKRTNHPFLNLTSFG
jgi:hypothetical protein